MSRVEKCFVIAVWADYTWCHIEAIEEYTWMSDDYMEIHVPESVFDVDRFLLRTKPQG